MDFGEGSERKWVQRPDSAVYIFCGDLKVAVYPSSPASHHPLPRSLPPSLCWPAPLRASQGRFLPQLGVLGCVAACLYWSVDFLVAACTYLNIPPAAALCSRPCTASPPPPPSPPPASLSHTLFLLYHSFTSGPLRHPVQLSIFSIFSLTLSFLSQSVFPLSLRAPSSIAAFSHDSVSVALSPLTLS